jgi:hypothetical protein
MQYYLLIKVFILDEKNVLTSKDSYTKRSYDENVFEKKNVDISSSIQFSSEKSLLRLFT